MKRAMRAACPNCEAVYALPVEMAARLPAAVRCAACGHVWDLTPEAAAAEATPLPAPAEADAEVEAKAEAAPDEATPAPVSEPVPEPPLVMPEPAPLPVPEPSVVVEARRVAVAPAEIWPSERVQWIVSGGALLVVIVLLFALHGPIGRAWPPMLRLYGIFGLG